MNMKASFRISEINWAVWWEKHQRYVFILALFCFIIMYQFFLLPQASHIGEQPPAKEKGVLLTDSRFEKKYSFPNIIDGRAGDWYRMGIYVLSSQSFDLNVLLHSPFDKGNSLGTLSVKTSENDQYYELIFSVSKNGLSDITLSLDDEQKLPTGDIQISQPILSRLNVQNPAEASRLRPTVVGAVNKSTKEFSFDMSTGDRVTATEYIEGADFIEGVQIARNNEDRQQKYTLELREKVFTQNGQKKEMVLRRVTLNPEDWHVENGENITHPADFYEILRREGEYIFSIQKAHNDTIPWFSNIQRGISRNKEEYLSLTAIVGRHTSDGGQPILQGARIEDLGDGLWYSYSLSGKMEDYFNIFQTKGKIWFDEKKSRVVGGQSIGAGVMYRFYMVHPFEKFILLAKQHGKKEQELRLEYSLDALTWQEVPVTKEVDGFWRFTLALAPTPSSDTVYIRTSFIGAERKMGTFGLDELQVRAQLRQ